MQNSKQKVLSIKNLEVKFRVRSRVLTAIRNVSFDLYDGEILALVGESGSGKSVITKTFTGMLEANGWVSDGSIIYTPSQISKTDDSAFFKNPVDIVGIEKQLIDNDIVSFISKINNAKISKLKRKRAHVLSLNPIGKEVDQVNMTSKIDEKISNLNSKLAYEQQKSTEFTKRKNSEKMAAIENKILELNFDKEIIFNEKIRDSEILKLDNEIKSLAIDIKKIKSFSAKDKAFISKIISIIETFVEDHVKPTSTDISDLYNYFESKIYKTRIENELLELLNGIMTNDNVDVDVFNNLVFDWSINSKNRFSNKRKSKKMISQLRGKTIATIFQDPMTSLNPLLTVGFQITEVLRKNFNMSRQEAKQEAIKLLEQVGIPNAASRYKDIPGRYSGGMRQRVVIAIALACRPKILICDEPTTALDVTIQAQILKLIKELQREYHFSVVFITHDLGVVANIANRVAVMYAGQIVEIGTSKEIFSNAQHPYTWALLQSLPQLGTKGEDLYSIGGTPPSLFSEIKGDAFAPRNKYALKIDYLHEPPMFKISDTHFAKTWLLHDKANKNIREKIDSQQKNKSSSQRSNK